MSNDFEMKCSKQCTEWAMTQKRKTTFNGRRSLTEDDLWRKTTFDRGTVYYLKKMFTTLQLDSHSTTDPKPEILSAVLTGNRIPHDGRNVRGIMHVHVCRKDDIFRQRRLNHSGVGGGIAFRRVYPARAYSTVVVLVWNTFLTAFNKSFPIRFPLKTVYLWVE